MDVYLNYSLPTMYVNVKLDHTLEKIKPIHSQQKLNNLYIYLSPQSYEYSIETASTYKNFIDGTEINMLLNKFTPIVCMEKTLYSDNNILYHYNLTDFANVNSYYDDFSISYDENSECYGIILNNKLKESFQHYCLYEKDNSNCPSYSTPVTPDTFNTVTVQSNAPTKIYIIENITQKTDLKYSMNNPLYIVGINSNGNYPLVTLGDLSSSSNITISEITLHGYLSIKANSVWLRRLTGTAIISAEVEDDVFTNEIDMISVYTQSSDIVLSSSKISFVYDSMGLHISDDSIEYHYSDPCESYIIMILQDEVDLAITIDDDFDLYPAISLHFDQYFSTINILYDGNIQKHAIININASKVKINSNSTFLPFHLIDTISLSVSGNDFIMPSLSIYTKPFEKLYCDINSTLLIKTLNLGYSQYNERTVNSAGDQLLVETLTIFETSNTVYILLIYRITVLKEIFYDTSAYFYGTVATDVSIIATIGTYGYPSLFLSTQSPVELSDIIVTMSVYTSRSLTLLYSESGYDFTYKRLSLRPSEFFDTWYGTKYTGNMISKKVLYNSIEYHSISVQFQYEYPEDIYIYALVILLPIAFGAGLLFGFIHCVCYCRMKKTIEEYEITEGLV